MPDVTYPKNPNSDTVFVEDGGKKTRAVKTVQLDGTVDYPSNPNSDSCYVTVDGKKQRALMVADVSSAGTVEYPESPNSTKGYVTVDGKKHRVNLTATLVGGGSAPVIDELNVTPSTSAQTITASGGVDGYSPVNVSAVTSSIDANISAGNIKKDVTILGVTGSYEGQQPSGTISITSNGTHDVSNYASADVQVPTTAPALYREFQLDANGVLQPNKTTTHIMNFTGMTDISEYALANAYKTNTAISGAIDMSDLTTVSGINACPNMFSNCTGITSIDLSSLTTISGQYSFSFMFFGCTGLTSANLSSLTRISGSNACQYMFSGCTGLTSADLSSLTTLGVSAACQYMFQGCTGLTSANLSGLTTITGSNVCSYMFSGCTSLATVYIGGTTAIDFGTRTNQFTNMFSACPQNIDVYAPAASQTDIEALSGYPKFGGTGTVTWHWRS